MRNIRRLAHIHIPSQWEPEEIVREVKGLGFSDLYFFAGNLEAGIDIGGMSVPLAMELGRLAEREGLGVIVNTGYMKYHEKTVQAHPDRCMVMRGGDLNWLCPFNEANKDAFKEELRQLARIPALCYAYLNDEAFLGTASRGMACYCDVCRKRFADHFGADPPEPEQEDWADPLWRNWIKWRFREWTALHGEFREVVRSVNPDVRVGTACACTVSPQRMPGSGGAFARPQ